MRGVIVEGRLYGAPCGGPVVAIKAAFIIAQSPAASPANARGGAGACVVPHPFVVPNKHAIPSVSLTAI